MEEGRSDEILLGLILSDLVSRKGLVKYLEALASQASRDISFESVRTTFGIGDDDLNHLESSVRQARDVKERLRTCGCDFVLLSDRGYPRLLREISSPPPILFYKGEPEVFETEALAIVGSRKPTLAGMNMARKLAYDLASRGFTIVSGLARGIDTAAHQGALEGGGLTIGVLGSGIDVVYPAENKDLAGAIAASGLVVSEFFPGTPPLRQNFPRRNRIISGLCLGTIVVEATRTSGALITAGFALDQNREVFAVPSSPMIPQSSGVNQLLRQGACLIESAEDVIAEIGPQVGSQLANRCDAAADPHLDLREQRIFDLLSGVPVHIDEIARTAQLESGTVLAILLRLETKGVARSLPGKFYVRQ